MKTQEIPEEKIREFWSNPFPEGSITDPYVRQSINDKIAFIFKAHPIHAVPDAVPEQRFSVNIKSDKVFGPDNINRQMSSTVLAANGLQVRGMKFRDIKRSPVIKDFSEDGATVQIPNPDGEIYELVFVLADGFEPKQTLKGGDAK